MQFFWHRNIQELIVLICLLVYTKPKNKTGCLRGAVAYCKVQSDDAKLYSVIYVVWFSGLRGYGNQRGGFDLLTLLVGTPPSWSETKSVPQTWTETTSTGGDHRVKQCFGPALLNRRDHICPWILMNQLKYYQTIIKDISSFVRPQGAFEGRQRRDSSESAA